MVSHASNPSIWEGGDKRIENREFQGQGWLHEILFGKQPNQKKSITSLTLTGYPSAPGYAVEFGRVYRIWIHFGPEGRGILVLQGVTNT